MKFQHPIFGKHDIGSVNGCVIFEPGAEGVKAAFILHQGEMDKGEISTDLNAYLERLRKDRLLRESLGIPVFAYHAYMFSMPYDPKVIRRLFEYIRSGCYEVRIWHNPMSAMLLVVYADSDTSEDSGWECYAMMKGCGFDGLGSASWYEFVAYGVPVPQDWGLVERGNKLFAQSPDGKQFIMF